MSETNDAYTIEQYHRMCRSLWAAVSPDGERDCATLAIDRIRTLEAERDQARADARALAAEVEIIRKVIRGSVKRLPDGTFVELPEHAFRRGWWLEAEEATKATDASGALERSKP